MNALQENPTPLEKQQEEPVTETEKEAPPQPLPWRNLDFWRFVLAALSLAWEIAKTFVR